MGLAQRRQARCRSRQPFLSLTCASETGPRRMPGTVGPGHHSFRAAASRERATTALGQGEVPRLSTEACPLVNLPGARGSKALVSALAPTARQRLAQSARASAIPRPQPLPGASQGLPVSIHFVQPTRGSEDGGRHAAYVDRSGSLSRTVRCGCFVRSRHQRGQRELLRHSSVRVGGHPHV